MVVSDWVILNSFERNSTHRICRAALAAVTTYPILAFCLGLDEGTMQAFRQDFSLSRALLFPLCPRWLLCCEEELGKHSGLMTLGMFFSPRCRALAIASDIILLAFSCLSWIFVSIWWCVLRGVLFSDEELDEDEDDEEEEEDDELLFTGGLRTRTWLLGPLAFFRGWKKKTRRESTVKHKSYLESWSVLWPISHKYSRHDVIHYRWHKQQSQMQWRPVERVTDTWPIKRSWVENADKNNYQREITLLRHITDDAVIQVSIHTSFMSFLVCYYMHPWTITGLFLHKMINIWMSPALNIRLHVV